LSRRRPDSVPSLLLLLLLLEVLLLLLLVVVLVLVAEACSTVPACSSFKHSRTLCSAVLLTRSSGRPWAPLKDRTSIQCLAGTVTHCDTL
jgi:Na+/H+-dicarboxylate symporter